ncbi:MAG: DNA polymerase IV [Mailhella sp.]|nr:DNA polymerase IV [Mailhella sp.]
MDAFFASIEQHDDPSLKGRPVIVGGGHRGVVSTCSYEARRYGVHYAMAALEARHLCPRGVFVKPRMARYAEVSEKVRAVLGDFSPRVEMASVDEAYLDATGMERVFGTVRDMGMRLKAAVAEATGGLTCSVGAAPVKFLAKISSEQRKPDGLFILGPDEMEAFLRNLPVKDVPGVGRHFAGELASLGIRTCGDVLRYGGEFWQRRFGKAGMELLHRSLGEDPREVVPRRPANTHSADTTLDEDTLDLELLKTWLMRHAERVGAALRRHGEAGRTVTLKIKYADFKQITRRTTLQHRTNSTETIYETACGLLGKLELEDKVRLIGVGVSGFEGDSPVQLSLIPGMDGSAEDERRGRIDAALDVLRGRYGKGAVVRGRLLEPASPGDGNTGGEPERGRRSAIR